MARARSPTRSPARPTTASKRWTATWDSTTAYDTAGSKASTRHRPRTPWIAAYDSSRSTSTSTVNWRSPPMLEGIALLTTLLMPDYRLSTEAVGHMSGSGGAHEEFGELDPGPHGPG